MFFPTIKIQGILSSMVALLEAILLGIIEGITEFLPISSTGHLIVSQSLLGFQDYKDLFAVVIQAGAIGAVIWYYRRDLVALLKNLGYLSSVCLARKA